jgi:hypothetical protein
MFAEWLPLLTNICCIVFGLLGFVFWIGLIAGVTCHGEPFDSAILEWIFSKRNAIVVVGCISVLLLGYGSYGLLQLYGVI